MKLLHRLPEASVVGENYKLAYVMGEGRGTL
jgi:hypothetical protein